ncbi:MAG: universal stress protein [Haloferacaceae archaeon]
MTLVVPFDGSELAEAALVRATEFGTVFDEDVLAVSVVPRRNASYAREHGRIEPGEPFDVAAVVSQLHEQVTDLAPSADFRHYVVDRHAPPGTIAQRVRRVARDEGAAMVFVGSENAGHMVAGVSSVGEGIASDDAYDVVIVRHRSPAKVATLENTSPYRPPKSEFYLPE